MKTIVPKDVKNNFYHLVGAAFIILNFIRHNVQGYKTPRPFSVYDVERVVAYDFAVVEKWLKAIKDYSNDSFSIRDKVILELGPGADLGVGLILLAMGAKKYIALDVNDLAFSAPKELYKSLFSRLMDHFPELDHQNLQFHGNPAKPASLLRCMSIGAPVDWDWYATSVTPNPPADVAGQPSRACCSNHHLVRTFHAVLPYAI